MEEDSTLSVYDEVPADKLEEVDYGSDNGRSSSDIENSLFPFPSSASSLYFIRSSDISSPDHSAASQSQTSWDHLSVALFERCPQIKTLVMDWTNDYNMIPSEAQRALLELIIQSAGVMLRLERDSVHLIPEMDVVTVDLLMNHATPNAFINDRRYLSNLKLFLKSALRETVLINDQFMQSVITLVSLMAESTWVNSRSTAVLFGALIADLYCQFIQRLEFVIEHNEDGLAPTLTDNLAVIKSLFDKILKFFISSMRDSDVNIRKTGMTILFGWTHKYPGLFLKDFYLRYFVWGIYDENTSVRLQAIQICRSMFELDTYLPPVKLLAKHALNGLVSRTMDNSVRVGVESIHAIKAIHRSMPELIKVERLVDIFFLTYSVSEPLGLAASALLYNIMTKESSEYTHFLKEMAIFLHESELALVDLRSESFLICQCEGVLTRRLLPHARSQLTDWQAWLTVLLDTDLPIHIQPIACRLLMAVIQHVTQHSVDTSPNIEINREEIKPNKKTSQSLKYQKEITIELGTSLLELWHRYRTNSVCLEIVIEIPEYFSNHIEDLEITSICFFLLTMGFHHRTGGSKYYSTLARILKLMSISPKWESSIKNIETLTYFRVVREFVNLTERISLQREECSPDDVLLLKRATLLTQKFDLTHTELYKNVFEAFSLANAQHNSLLSRYCATICFNLIKCHLNNIKEGKYSKEEKAEILKLRKYIKYFDKMLKQLAHINLFAARRVGFKLYCLHQLLFSHSLGEKYTCLQIDRPTLVMCDWLHFILHNEVPKDVVAKGKAKKNAKEILSLFCSMLIIEAIPISYLSSIIPYFSHYYKEDNYNDLLKNTMEILIKREGVAIQIVESLAMIFIEPNSHYYRIMRMSLGICELVFPRDKLSDRSLIEKVCLIASTGCVKMDSTDFQFIHAVIPFLLLLPSNVIWKVINKLAVKYSSKRHLIDDILTTVENVKENPQLILCNEKTKK